MQIIQLQVSDELAEQLIPYHEQLSILLAIGLQTWQQHTHATPDSTDERIRSILAASGWVILPMVETNPEPYVRQTPVSITGKPVSEIVIEQRGQ
ncbi:MAG: hypothetical protein NT075_04945 [Chloroflexi bacterium]|nr:hypothetical protein [Chloroflexota bacterium]